MASLDSTITFTRELRPCYVNGAKALFHRWAEYKHIVEPSALKGGHNGGEIAFIKGIVEYEGGQIDEVSPREIHFYDDKINIYAFRPDKDAVFDLRNEIDRLKLRISHLLKSDIIREFDAKDRRTQEYKKDVSKFDEEFKKYKEAFEILSKCTNCNTCIKSRDCKYIKWGDYVVYNCPHFKQGGA